MCTDLAGRGGPRRLHWSWPKGQDPKPGFGKVQSSDFEPVGPIWKTHLRDKGGDVHVGKILETTRDQTPDSGACM